MRKGKNREKKVQVKRVRACMAHDKNYPNNAIFLPDLYHAFYAGSTVETGKGAEDIKQKDYIEETAESYGISPKLVKAIIKVESGGDADAVGDNGNSLGLMQIQPRYHGWRLAEGESLKDPRVNVRIGCEILQDLLYKSHGDVGAALTVYNAGYDTGDRSYYYKVMEEMEKWK